MMSVNKLISPRVYHFGYHKKDRLISVRRGGRCPQNPLPMGIAGVGEMQVAVT
jgi:hypothetical protein